MDLITCHAPKTPTDTVLMVVVEAIMPITTTTTTEIVGGDVFDLAGLRHRGAPA